MASLAPQAGLRLPTRPRPATRGGATVPAASAPHPPTRGSSLGPQLPTETHLPLARELDGRLAGAGCEQAGHVVPKRGRTEGRTCLGRPQETLLWPSTAISIFL